MLRHTHFIVLALLATPSADLAGAQSQEWTLEETAAFGGPGSASALTRVSDMAVTGDGRWLVVGQPQENLVRMIDTRHGTRDRTLGRRGSGPGEFRSVQSVGVVGDTIMVADLQQQRVSLFSASSGDHIRTARIASEPLNDARRPATPVQPTPTGDYWGEPALSYMLVANGEVDEIPVVLLSDTGEILEVVTKKTVSETVSFAEIGGRKLFFAQPLVLPTLLGYSPDGTSLIHAENREDGSVRLRRFDPTGTSVYARVLRRPRVPVGREVSDSLFDVFASMFDGSGRAAVSSARRAARDHVTIPDYLPTVTRVLVMRDGGAWLRLNLSDSWLAVDPAGRERGVITAPAGVTLYIAAEDEAWGVRHDELDVPVVVRLRMRPGTVRPQPRRAPRRRVTSTSRSHTVPTIVNVSVSGS